VLFHWAGYFEQLNQVDPPAVTLDGRHFDILIADRRINCDSLSFVETQAAVKWLKCGQAPGIYGIHIELLKAGGNSVLMSLYAGLFYAWNSHHPN